MKGIFLIAFVGLLLEVSLAGQQRYTVKGRLLCGTAPAKEVKVKLIDIDVGSDDVMDTKKTDSQGNFNLDGTTNEATNIDPVLKIYHDCLDNLPGQRRWKLDLPKKYIVQGGSGSTPKPFDIGVLNLEPKMHEEERDFV